MSPQELKAIHRTLRGMLMAYHPPLVAKVDSPGRVDLWTNKPAVVAGRKRQEVFFASAIIQKGYVGLYFMPVYAAPELKRVFDPDLLALLKGKSCFHIKALDARLRARIKSALARGFSLYTQNGWV